MSTVLVTATKEGVRIALLVQPRASRVRFGPTHGDRLKVAITTAPVDGAANQAVVDLLAKTLGVAKRDISITAGHTSRRKTVEVACVSPEKVEACIA